MILSDLQTKGGEFLFDGKEYVGFYNMVDSITFTGRAFDSTSKRIEAMPVLVKEYQAISTLRIGDAPMAFYPSPTTSDYMRGWISRYFAKKATDEFAHITEISKDTFNKFFNNDNTVDWALYKVIELRWKISGGRHDIVNIKTNQIVSPGVFETNAREINEAEKEMRGISEKLPSLVEFYVPPVTSPSAIQQVTNFTNNLQNSGEDVSPSSPP